MPQEQVEGTAGHVEVGERYEGRDDGVGCECSVEEAVSVAQRVPKHGKRELGDGRSSPVIRTMRGQRETL